MSSVCISNCVNDTRDPRVPVRATYVNLYKWPESDAEFVRSVSSRGCKPATTAGATAGAVRFGPPRVVDSISCRQMYLRSYKFSREDDHDDQQKKKKVTQKCFGCRVLDDHDLDDHADQKEEKKKKKSSSSSRGSSGRNVSKGKKNKNKKKKRCLFLGKVKEISYAALFGIFQRCLSCAATVDVVDQQD